MLLRDEVCLAQKAIYIGSIKVQREEPEEKSKNERV
jgi:hypothetical protein